MTALLRRPEKADHTCTIGAGRARKLLCVSLNSRYRKEDSHEFKRKEFFDAEGFYTGGDHLSHRPLGRGEGQEEKRDPGGSLQGQECGFDL